MEIIKEQSFKKDIKTGGIRSPEEPAVGVWMVRPDSTIGRVKVAENVSGGVLRAKGGKVFVTMDAQAKGWSSVRETYGPDKEAELEAWDEKCKAAAKKKGPARVFPPAPDFFAKANGTTKIVDHEPPEGIRLAEKKDKERRRRELRELAGDSDDVEVAPKGTLEALMSRVAELEAKPDLKTETKAKAEPADDTPKTGKAKR